MALEMIIPDNLNNLHKPLKVVQEKRMENEKIEAGHIIEHDGELYSYNKKTNAYESNSKTSFEKQYNDKKTISAIGNNSTDNNHVFLKLPSLTKENLKKYDIVNDNERMVDFEQEDINSSVILDDFYVENLKELIGISESNLEDNLTGTEKFEREINSIFKNRYSTDVLYNIDDSKESQERFMRIKNEIIKLYNEVNVQEKSIDNESKISMLLDINKKIYELLKRNGIVFPKPTVNDLEQNKKPKDDSFSYYYYNFMKKRNFFPRNAISFRAKNGVMGAEIINELYKIDNIEKTVLIDEKIDNLNFIKNLSKADYNKIKSDNNVDVVFLGELLTKKDNNLPLWAASVAKGNILIFKETVLKHVDNNETRYKNHVYKESIPNEKAHIIGGLLNMNVMFQEPLSDAFSFENMNDEDIAEFIWNRVNTLESIGYMFNYICIENSLNYISRNKNLNHDDEKIDLMRNTEKGYKENIKNFKEVYWETFNNLYSSTNPEELVDKINKLKVNNIYISGSGHVSFGDDSKKHW